MEWEVALIRHGQTDWNKMGRFQGTKDIPLNREGVREAEMLAKGSLAYGWRKIYTSDLGRAVETAKKVAERAGIPLIVEPAFRERHFGTLEGEEFAKIVETYGTGDVRILERMGFGIESTEILQRRLILGMERVLASVPSGSVAIVSHGGAINAFLTWATQGRLGIGVTRLRNTSVTRLITDGEHWEVVGVNEFLMEG